MDGEQNLNKILFISSIINLISLFLLYGMSINNQHFNGKSIQYLINDFHIDLFLLSFELVWNEYVYRHSSKIYQTWWTFLIYQTFTTLSNSFLYIIWIFIWFRMLSMIFDFFLWLTTHSNWLLYISYKYLLIYTR